MDGLDEVVTRSGVLVLLFVQSARSRDVLQGLSSVRGQVAGQIERLCAVRELVVLGGAH